VDDAQLQDQFQRLTADTNQVMTPEMLFSILEEHGDMIFPLSIDEMMNATEGLWAEDDTDLNAVVRSTSLSSNQSRMRSNKSTRSETDRLPSIRADGSGCKTYIGLAIAKFSSVATWRGPSGAVPAKRSKYTLDVEGFQKMMSYHYLRAFELRQDEEGFDFMCILQDAFREEAKHNFVVQAQDQQRKRAQGRHEPKPIGWVAIALEIVPSCIIMINAGVIACQADIDPDNDIWEYFEVVFLACYLLEAFIKIYIKGCYFYWCGQDRFWNWFDWFCMLISMADLFFAYAKMGPDLSDQAIIKMLRLVRLLRLGRALHYPIFKELRTILLGVVSGIRVLFWALILLLVCVFLLGILMKKLDDQQEELATVPAAMFTVFRCFTEGCTDYQGRPLSESLREEYGAAFLLGYILVIMFVTFGLFNLIMAVFIENVVGESDARRLKDLGETASSIKFRIEETFAGLILEKNEYLKEACKSRQSGMIRKLSPELGKKIEEGVHHTTSLFLQLPDDFQIPREVFLIWLCEPEVAKLLEEADINVSMGGEDLFDVLDVDMGGSLGLDELINGLMRLRGPTTKSDIVAMGLKVQYCLGLVNGLVSDASRDKRFSQSHEF
jgi:hypothetical protein